MPPPPKKPRFPTPPQAWWRGWGGGDSVGGSLTFTKVSLQHQLGTCTIYRENVKTNQPPATSTFGALEAVVSQPIWPLLTLGTKKKKKNVKSLPPYGF